MLIELIPSIDSGISSEVLQAFNCTISTYIIAISGLKMFSYGSEWGKYRPLTLARAGPDSIRNSLADLLADQSGKYP